MARMITALMVLGALIAAGWFVFGRSGASQAAIAPRVSFGAAVASDYVVPPIVGDYKNDEFRFSLKMPDGFRASELPVDENGSKTVLLQDAAGNGIQIYITPSAGGAKTLTAANVRAAIPDMRITDDQAVEIGSDYRGVAFMSDNEAFGGASREVWFFFNGNLYQISTYARLDNLLQAMFGTWQFF